MSSILVPEVASLFGAIDSSAIADGEPLDAHVLRAMGMSANRLLCQGEPLLVLPYDVAGNSGIPETDDEGTQEGGPYGFGSPFWVEIIPPVTCYKKPGLTSAKLFVRHSITSGGILYVQLATRAQRFSDTASSDNAPNVLKLTGTGGWTTESIAGIPIDYGVDELVSLSILGAPGDLGATGTYGTPNSGSVDLVIDAGCILYGSGATTWADGSGVDSWAGGGHAIVFVDPITGVELVTPRQILQTQEASRIVFWPTLSPFEQRMIADKAFEIRKLVNWRFGAISLYAEDRSFA